MLEAASMCPQLKVLEIKAYVWASTTSSQDLTAVPPGLYGPHIPKLPAGLKVLRLNFTPSLTMATYNGEPASLEALEVPRIDIQPEFQVESLFSILWDSFSMRLCSNTLITQ